MKECANIIYIIAIIMANLVFSEDCYPPGDTNWDGTLDILNIVVTVNSTLGSSFNECSDINGQL